MGPGFEPLRAYKGSPFATTAEGLSYLPFHIRYLPFDICHLTFNIYLERQTDGKVEGEVALEIGMDDGIVVTRIGIGRIDGLHTAVETKDEVIEV